MDLLCTLIYIILGTPSSTWNYEILIPTRSSLVKNYTLSLWCGHNAGYVYLILGASNVPADVLPHRSGMGVCFGVLEIIEIFIRDID